MKRLFFPILLGSLLLLGACDKDDDDSSSGGTGTSTPGNAAFTCVIDGQSFTADPLFVVGTSSNSGLHNRVAGGIRIANGDTLFVAITVASFDPTAFETGATFDGADILGNWCFGGVSLDNGGMGDYTATSDDLALPCSVTLTAYDPVASTFSGTFAFDANDEDANVTNVITNGVFTNIEFN